MYRTSRTHLNVSKHIRQHPHASENVGKRQQMTMKFEKIRKRPNASDRIRTHLNVSERIRTRPKASTNVRKQQQTFEKWRKVEKVWRNLLRDAVNCM